MNKCEKIPMDAVFVEDPTSYTGGNEENRTNNAYGSKVDSSPLNTPAVMDGAASPMLGYQTPTR